MEELVDSCAKCKEELSADAYFKAMKENGMTPCCESSVEQRTSKKRICSSCLSKLPDRDDNKVVVIDRKMAASGEDQREFHIEL